MKCKYCSQGCVKAGFQKNGEQKYFCKKCRKYQQASYQYNAYRINRPYDQFVKLHNEGIGIRGMSRILDISCNTVLRWKINIANSIKPPEHHAYQHQYQIDELHTYIGHKQRPVWIKYIFDLTSKQVVGFRVGARTKENLEMLIAPVLNQNPVRISTDGLISYRALIPESIHKVGLRYTRHIERHNLNLRMHLKYLGRKTICFARNIEMLEASLKIYFWSDVSSSC